MAHLVRPWITRYIDPKTKKRVKKDHTYAKPVKVRATKWYGQGIPGLPPSKRVPLASDKAAAKRMLDKLVRDAEQGQAGLPDRDAGRRTLAEHLRDFEQDVALGLGSKGGRKRHAPDPKQVAAVVGQVRIALDGCALVMPADLNAAAPAKLAKYLQDLVKLPREKGGISPQTAEFRLAAARRFVRWIARKAAVPADLFDGVPGFDPKQDRRHARREISPDELFRILETARTSTRVIRDLTGPDRYHLYLVAFATGYRSGELAELCPENFDLDAEPPTAALPAKLTKNRKAARQPLPPGVAHQLREFLTSKRAGKPVWPGTWSEKPAKMLRKDLAAAEVPYVINTIDGPRYADFHALRHSYVSALAAAGVVGKELQELARHSDPRLTLGIYTHARAEALGASVARLQLPAAAGENPLARLTRSGLEGAVIALAVALRTLTGCTVVAPRVALPMETGADGNETGVHHRPGRTGRSDSPQTVNQRHPETA